MFSVYFGDKAKNPKEDKDNVSRKKLKNNNNGIVDTWKLSFIERDGTAQQRSSVSMHFSQSVVFLKTQVIWWRNLEDWEEKF